MRYRRGSPGNSRRPFTMRCTCGNSGFNLPSDAALFELAARENRTLVSEDTDFGTLLALREAAEPSVILFRHMLDRSAANLSRLLLANLSVVEADLAAGAIVVFDATRIRIRRLPVGGRTVQNGRTS